VRVCDPRIGSLAVPGIVPKLSETPGRIDHLGQNLGSSNQEIYGGLLGLSVEEMVELEGRGVI
jgi:crotonobetainyl-CoA:carnitine CoA-transferase CaiB-like acyl-CoA transferase